MVESVLANNSERMRALLLFHSRRKKKNADSESSAALANSKNILFLL